MSRKLHIDDLPQDVKRLVFTSDQDLKSALGHAHHLNLDVLAVALKWCDGREGYKTKAVMIAAVIKRVQRGAKEQGAGSGEQGGQP